MNPVLKRESKKELLVGQKNANVLLFDRKLQSLKPNICFVQVSTGCGYRDASASPTPTTRWPCWTRGGVPSVASSPTSGTTWSRARPRPQSTPCSSSPTATGCTFSATSLSVQVNIRLYAMTALAIVSRSVLLCFKKCMGQLRLSGSYNQGRGRGDAVCCVRLQTGLTSYRIGERRDDFKTYL